jgi:hypothetical protein
VHERAAAAEHPVAADLTEHRGLDQDVELEETR